MTLEGAHIGPATVALRGYASGSTIMASRRARNWRYCSRASSDVIGCCQWSLWITCSTERLPHRAREALAERLAAGCAGPLRRARVNHAPAEHDLPALRHPEPLGRRQPVENPHHRGGMAARAGRGLFIFRVSRVHSRSFPHRAYCYCPSACSDASRLALGSVVGGSEAKKSVAKRQLYSSSSVRMRSASGEATISPAWWRLTMRWAISGSV